MIGSRQPRITKPTGMSLAQFTRNLSASQSQGPPRSADSQTVGPENVGQKRFAADVMVAMSKPVLEEEVLPNQQQPAAAGTGS